MNIRNTRNTRIPRLELVGLLGLVGLLSVACGDGGEPPDDNVCLQPLAATCTPDINITYDEIYSRVLSPSCLGSGCHGATNTQGNLNLSTPDLAYQQLLGQDGARARVLPGDPECSMLLERIETDDRTRRMPYMAADKLRAGARCAIQKWIEAGAQR
ncbi:MAG: c-type cytochrome domain-containing protein [Polyangiales bacterium]